MEQLTPPPFIYLNGYPGVGKLAVAKELCKLLPKAKVLNNHLLIDPAAAIFDRNAEEYQPLRKVLRQEVLKSIATAESTRDVAWIFTDSQSSSKNGSASARDYQNAASVRNSPFISVILQCEIDENLKRAASEDRGTSNTKLTDLTILQNIRENEDIFHFGDEDELELDVTYLSPSDAARKIYEHICKASEKYTTKDSQQLSVVKKFEDIKGFKHVFINDLHKSQTDRQVNILCWLVSRPRVLGGVLFLSVCDSTGSIQVVANSSTVSSWSELKVLKPESSLVVSGTLATNRDGGMEIIANGAVIVSKAVGMIHPAIRKADPIILEAVHTNHVLSNRHLYLRNPVILSLNLYRSQMFSAIQDWFKTHRFVDFSAPLITPSILYEPEAAIHIANLKTNKKLFLSQCAGFYLEAAAHAHERVYNLGPSFRNESRTNRHLVEYWHIKAELCSGRMDDIIEMVEVFIRDVFEAVREHTEKITTLLGTELPTIQLPFSRITYRKAVELLNEKGHKISFGQNVSKPAENILTDHFGGPVWVTHKPLALEPFPYCVCPDDKELTMTADLISSNGFGEICGVAEKSFTREELELRLKEKGKSEQLDMYGWVLQSRDFGMVPHTAFGMGFERVLRWFCGVPHVKDMIPFPRVFGRDLTP